MKRWITNLESLDWLAAQEQTPVIAEKTKACFRTMELIRKQYGHFEIGPCHASEEKTAAQIEADGHVGIYLPGTAVVK